MKLQSAPHISARLRNLRSSSTLKLRQLVSELRGEGRRIYDFGLGETFLDLPEDLRKAGADAFWTGATRYVATEGIAELREAVLRYKGLEKHYQPNNVVVTTGAKQSLFNCMLAVADPGETVLLEPAPWVSYLPMCHLLGIHAVPVLASPANHLKMTPDDIRRELARHDRARALLVNSPVNPTAQLYSASELEEIIRLCCEKEIYLILDMLYWRIVYDGMQYPNLPITEETRQWLLLVDGISKNFPGCGGLRIGFTVAPDEVSAVMASAQSHVTSNASVPAQKAALAAMQKVYDDSLVRALEHNRAILLEEAAAIPGVKLWPIPASFYSFWDIVGLIGRHRNCEIRNSVDVAEYLLREAGVVVAPGSMFEQEGYLRLSFSRPPDEVREGIRAVKQALENL